MSAAALEDLRRCRVNLRAAHADAVAAGQLARSLDGAIGHPRGSPNPMRAIGPPA
jgi:hypothetical protein